MSITALVVTVLACAAIIVVGTRFLLTPRVAAVQYGIAPDNHRAFAAIKGVRDVTSGIVLLVVWAVAGRDALGWATLAAALTPIGDMIIVLRSGGKPAQALGIHGLTAAVLVAAGLVLGLA